MLDCYYHAYYTIRYAITGAFVTPRLAEPIFFCCRFSIFMRAQPYPPPNAAAISLAATPLLDAVMPRYFRQRFALRHMPLSPLRRYHVVACQRDIRGYLMPCLRAPLALRRAADAVSDTR